MKEEQSYPLSCGDSVLLVIDVQEKLAAAMDPEELSKAAAWTARLIEGCSVLSVPVAVTEQYSKGLGSTLSSIPVSGKYPVFEKISFDAFSDSSIAGHLSSLSRKTVILAGMEAHICVFFTALHLLNAGWRVCVVSDAVCSRSVQNKETALLQLRKEGAFVVPAETVLFSLVERGGTDQFRKISSIVK
jgi:nicotinamidase-related amidase